MRRAAYSKDFQKVAEWASASSGLRERGLERRAPQKDPSLEAASVRFPGNCSIWKKRHGRFSVVSAITRATKVFRPLPNRRDAPE